VTTPAKIIRVLCVDDHPLVRKGIASILENQPDIELVGEAGNGREALSAFRTLRPHVVLMDLRMPGIDGVGTTKLIMNEDPAAKIIALTSYYGDQEIYSALDAGVQGYILKETVHTEVVRAIRAVHEGKKVLPLQVTGKMSEYFPGAALTQREIEVLRLAAQGLGNKEIGQQLGTSASTAKMHLQNIFSKLGASDRTHALAISIRRGIIHLDP
jgi:DNA-binding NarL/FixJ family response regulator